MDNKELEMYMDGKAIHATKSSSNSIVTVLAIVGGVLLIAILWNAWSRNKCEDHNHHRGIDSQLGALTAQVGYISRDLGRVENYERNDYGRISYMEGREYNEGRGRGCNDNCGTKTRFQEVKKGKVTEDNFEITETCG